MIRYHVELVTVNPLKYRMGKREIEVKNGLSLKVRDESSAISVGIKGNRN